MGAFFWIKLYLFTVPVFFAIDMLWLGFLARGFYKDRLGHLLSPEVNWPAAISFYLIYICGILFFCVAPAISRESLPRAAFLGALFGFFTYSTYDFTNLATLKDWPKAVVAVDILWGVVLCTAVASASFLIARRLL